MCSHNVEVLEGRHAEYKDAIYVGADKEALLEVARGSHLHVLDIECLYQLVVVYVIDRCILVYVD